MLWNASTSTPLPNFAAWAVPPRADWGERLENLPTFSMYQDPGWFTQTFAVTGVDAAGAALNLSADGVWPSGGWQGGRNTWGDKMGQPDNRLSSGPWYVENAFAELDAQGEYYFNASTRQLFVFYNASGAPPADFVLVASQLEVFFNLSGSAADPVADVTFAGVAFRDQRSALLDDWLVPSGGDWALRRAGALHLEGTERATVTGCAFVRTDANAIAVVAYNRNATIEHSEFAWLGMSAVIEFGFTAFNDGTAGLQPWGTVMSFNKVHEIGLYELQSSALFLGKTALTRLEGNILFNGPRAEVNVNDGLGGGHNFTRNLVFNTCRQSGDHVSAALRAPRGKLPRTRPSSPPACPLPPTATTAHPRLPPQTYVIARHRCRGPSSAFPAKGPRRAAALSDAPSPLAFPRLDPHLTATLFLSLAQLVGPPAVPNPHRLGRRRARQLQLAAQRRRAQPSDDQLRRRAGLRQ